MHAPKRDSFAGAALLIRVGPLCTNREATPRIALMRSQGHFGRTDHPTAMILARVPASAAAPRGVLRRFAFAARTRPRSPGLPFRPTAPSQQRSGVGPVAAPRAAGRPAHHLRGPNRASRTRATRGHATQGTQPGPRLRRPDTVPKLWRHQPAPP